MLLIIDCLFLGYAPGTIAVNKPMQLDMNSLAEYLKKTLDINPDGKTRCIIKLNIY